MKLKAEPCQGGLHDYTGCMAYTVPKGQPGLRLAPPHRGLHELSLTWKMRESPDGGLPAGE